MTGTSEDLSGKLDVQPEAQPLVQPEAKLPIYQYTNRELVEYLKEIWPIAVVAVDSRPALNKTVDSLLSRESQLFSYYEEHGTVVGSGVFGTRVRGTVTNAILSMLLRAGYEPTREFYLGIKADFAKLNGQREYPVSKGNARVGFGS